MTSIIYEDIQGDDYLLLLNAALQKCNRFAFVKRRDMMADEEVAMKHFYKLVEEIQESLIEMKEQSEWETTQLLESTAYVFYYELNEKTKEFLKNKSKSLFGWLSPFLPEDLMLYKDNENWLAACSHEGWYSVDKDLNNTKDFINILRKELSI